jgi:hypothetical protein
MPPHFRVIKLRHRPRHPTQIKAHTVLHRRHIQFFCHVDVYMHYLAGDVNFLFRWVSLHRRSPRFNALGGHFPLASFLGERLRIVGSWTWPATKVPFWGYSPTTLRLPSHYSVITWRRRSESNRRVSISAHGPLNELRLTPSSGSTWFQRRLAELQIFPASGRLACPCGQSDFRWAEAYAP